MTQIVLDQVLRSKLPDLSQPWELCDESGKVLARVIPVLDPSQYEPAELPTLSAEELQRRRQEPDYSTWDVLDYLEKL